ncbi:MAG: mechanosensitive ion channel [Xenococcaceae cyanobacterium MO_167.B52]|nr:mechanosensitive ion channel [Xenococcaceae cyanobacterium MO_167.B52]
MSSSDSIAMSDKNQFSRNFYPRQTFNFSRIGKVLVILLCFLLLVAPLAAQNNPLSPENMGKFASYSTGTPAKAAVVIDAQEIFQISGTEQLTAEKRAQIINSELQLAIQLPHSLEIEIKQVNDLPTIYINNRYLMTVTSDDVTRNNSVQQQANIWTDRLQATIKQAQRARTSRYIWEKAILALIVLVVVFAIDKILSLLKHYALPRAIAKLVPGINSTRLKSPHLRLFFQTQLTLARLVLWLVIFYWLSGLLPQSRHWRNQILGLLKSSFLTPIFTLSDRSYSLIDLVILGGFFWLLVVATQTITTLLRTRILHQTRMSRGSQEVIFVIVKYGLISFGTIILLQVWGVNLSSIAILGSALGVGIGFGFQDIAKNFASGVVLLFERSVQIGDFIEVNGHRGTVERIQARSIILKTLDSVSIVVPNSYLLAGEVINWSHDSPISRFALPVGVAYGSNPEIVKEVLLGVAKGYPEILTYPVPQVFFIGFGDSSLDFELRVWMSDPSRQPIVKSELYFQIEKVLRDRHIEIPFPQRDIHLRGNIPLGIAPDLETALLRWLKDSNQPSSN